MLHQETRLAVFQELVQCFHALYLWTYDPEMRLLESNCPESAVTSGLFVPTEYWADIVEYVRQNHKPTVMSSDLGLVWITDGNFEKDTLVAVHVLGPFFMYEITPKQIEQKLLQRNLVDSLLKPTLEFLRSLPVISTSRVTEYGVMLHYCITGEKLRVDEIHFSDNQVDPHLEEAGEGIHGTYEAEREMLRLVREGDLNFKKHMQVIAGTGRVGNIGDGQALRQLKNMIIVNITLFSRAAMEGGLPPETAYTLSDRYYQAVEKSSTFPAIVDLNTSMQEDFVQRVHQFRQNKSLSKPIRTCVEQMHTRMEEDITLEQLAKEFGYSTYYLSRKFRSETGQTFKDYLRQIRLERAKFLLRNTDDPILLISERLQFCSQSYFSDTFRKYCGISPSEYREQLSD